MDTLEIAPATPDRWDAVRAVMGTCYNSRSCWCDYWYLPNAEYRAGWGKTNGQTLEGLILGGSEPGLVAIVDGTPAAWVSVGPRRNFDRLNRSRNFAPIDDAEVWAVNCFVVAPAFRKQGLVTRLAAAAADFAIANGADGAEAYPIVPSPRSGPPDLFVGTERAFLDAGYTEVARPLPRRPVMRRMK